ncbi:spore germination protein [Virgibacillus alimentarius]|uniref:spore germination protein n=1 Tax=Virgibacillus alimentarius TaxID=698769 RepID=UPI00049317A8|nr:spore germination protein [Virgibacillus alimentarius]
MGGSKRKTHISSNIKDVQAYMKERVGVGISYDLEFRELVLLKRKVQLYFLNGQVSDLVAIEIIKKLVSINDEESNQKKLFEIVENRLANLSVEHTNTMDEAVNQMLSGLIIVFVDGEKKAFIVDVRDYPGRQPEEPDTERVIRGSRDGFTENVIINTALTRRRIRDARLRHEMLSVGERSKTDVCLCYIKDIANDEMIELTKDKIRSIEIDGITMADKALEEFIIENKWNPFPLVRYTERPDVAANHLFEGHLLLIVDTSPSVIILPTTYFDHLEHAEEYRQSPAVGTFIRWSRLLAVFASLFLLPLWLLFSMEPTLLPKTLSFIGPNEEGTIPVAVQIILAVLGVEFVRMAAVHTPTPLATALGLIAAVVIGQIAIDVGMFSPEVILYIAISTIGVYVTPSYELSVANKLLKLLLIIITALFGVPGFLIGLLLSTLFLVNMNSLRTPYLWPFIPFNAGAMLKFIFRIPVPFSEGRPSIVYPKDTISQEVKN